MQISENYRLRVMNEFGTLSERFGRWSLSTAQARCLALASDTLDPVHLCASQLGQWESVGDAFTCHLFHKGYTRVTHQLRVEPRRSVCLS